jgi:Alcohol dehydrogenase GroES-like domain
MLAALWGTPAAGVEMPIRPHEGSSGMGVWGLMKARGASDWHRFPRSMRAVVITEHGGPGVLQVQERPDPPVGPGEVRIAVKAAGISFADTLARTGLYPDAPKVPCVVGYEVAGEVESVGEGVVSVKPGDRVLAGTRFNGQAELVTVRENMLYTLPQQLSFEEGAASRSTMRPPRRVLS